MCPPSPKPACRSSRRAAARVPRVGGQAWRHGRGQFNIRACDVVGGELVFFSFGSNHHDLALLEAPQTRPADPQCAGLAHVALRIGDHIDTLRTFHAHLRVLGVALHHASDHEVSQWLYLREPDGLLIEVYVDADPTVWADRPEAVATVRPLRADGLDGNARRLA